MKGKTVTDEDMALLERNGWNVDCESPFEISKTRNGEPVGFASGEAAHLIGEYLRGSYAEVESRVDEPPGADGNREEVVRGQGIRLHRARRGKEGRVRALLGAQCQGAQGGTARGVRPRRGQGRQACGKVGGADMI